MISLDNLSREDLMAYIADHTELYSAIDEHLLLNDGYTTEELRDIVRAWIVAGEQMAGESSLENQ